jgi:hypothetical protein
VRGSGTYTATLNPTNPVGTIQSIEYALRSLERMAERETEKLQQLESDLAAYRRELGKPFEHETRLKELLLKQAELNAALDLHKAMRKQPPYPRMTNLTSSRPDNPAHA